MLKLQKTNLTQNDNGYIPVDTLLILKNGDNIGPVSGDYILPQFISMSFGKGAKGIMANADITRSIYHAVSEPLKYLFSSMSVCEKQEKEYGRQLWQSCLEEDNDNYVYMKFHSQLPFTMLYNYILGGDLTVQGDAADGDLVFVKEIFIFYTEYSNGSADSGSGNENVYGIYGVSRDEQENVAVFKYNIQNQDAQQYFEISGLMSYYGSGNLYSYTFKENYPGADDFSVLLKDSAIIINSETNIFTRDLHAGPAMADARSGSAGDTGNTSNTGDTNITDSDGSADNKILSNEFLKIFNYNPDKLSTYTEADVSQVYIETHGTLRYTPGIRLEYSASEGSGGLEISAYLNYESNNNEYSAYEMMKAAGIIIESIKKNDKSMLGGEARPQLSDIYYQNGSLVLQYNYYYDNIPLLTEENQPYAACTITVKESKIIGIAVNSLNVTAPSQRLSNYPLIWVLENIKNSNDDDNEDNGNENNENNDGNIHNINNIDDSETGGTDVGKDIFLAYILEKSDTQSQYQFKSSWVCRK